MKPKKTGTGPIRTPTTPNPPQTKGPGCGPELNGPAILSKYRNSSHGYPNATGPRVVSQDSTDKD